MPAPLVVEHQLSYDDRDPEVCRKLVAKNSSFVNNSFDRSSNKDMKPYIQDAVGSAIISSTSLDSHFAPI